LEKEFSLVVTPIHPPLGDIKALSDTPFEARGEIDDSKVNDEVLKRHEMEADEDEHGLEEDSSDDEDDPLVPRDWDSSKGFY
jgi:hypothetical protein